ncbi:hypothetical protein HD600_001863 [Microbacterium ginsengiterrae]|uniref:GDSL-like lipase/acylhydrolase family protein n=1 Tax=Microbacterium ginsengiterrae TaxID=546115 RepID=A0A7W9FBJ4_9MICO|nr:hypothetical protein [Microbacterium ginsengiterrae]MBB5743366.1 hypothetical protein [Microbacterium ginsengiterrae]
MPMRRMRRRSAAVLLLLAAFAVASCAGPVGIPPAPEVPSPSAEASSPPVPDTSTPDAADLDALAGMHVFFAHRSVGADVMEMGVPAVYAAAGAQPPPDGFGDHWLDQTDDPATKLADFDRWVREDGVGERADVAFMKLGYVDILADTDVQRLFDEYRAMMDALESDYPEVVFLHATVSVTAWDPENNAAIEAFNALMRDRYADTGRLYDLAAVVSTCADGTPARGETAEGAVYYRICDEFTRDGGHLNEHGATVAASALLRLLVSVAP